MIGLRTKRPDDAAGVSGRDTGMEVPMPEQSTPRTPDEDAARRGQCCEFCGAVTGLERYRPVGLVAEAVAVGRAEGWLR
jgi:hypothetical protein